MGVKDREILVCVGRNIQAVRRTVGMTQECLAELVGVHWQTISGIERARYPFAITTFARIVQHLGVSADDLLAGLKSPDPKRSRTIRKAQARKRRIAGTS